jgi:hypothetical protein
MSKTTTRIGFLCGFSLVVGGALSFYPSLMLYYSPTTILYLTQTPAWLSKQARCPTQPQRNYFRGVGECYLQDELHAVNAAAHGGRQREPVKVAQRYASDPKSHSVSVGGRKVQVCRRRGKSPRWCVLRDEIIWLHDSYTVVCSQQRPQHPPRAL